MYRNAEKVAAACKALSGKGGKISSYTCDLGSFTQIRKLTESVKADFRSIEVLINNAGVFEQRRVLSQDGFEMTWAINVLAPFLLTSLLKDIVTERIVNVSSISASSRIDFDNLQQVTFQLVVTLCILLQCSNFQSTDNFQLLTLACTVVVSDMRVLLLLSATRLILSTTHHGCLRKRGKQAIMSPFACPCCISPV